jgi:FMN phosphatase YigB (HAD superfamily)
VYAQAIYKAEKTYTKNAEGKRGPLYDEYGDVVNGFTFHLLFHGMRDNNLTPYVQLVLDAVESSRCFIKDTKKIYDYLRYKKGYSIVLATNNDHVAYEISAKALGEEFTRLADYVFVAQPGNSSAFLSRLQDFAMQPATPQTYKNLLYKVLTIQPTKNIIHTPGKKPEYEYYHFIEQQFNPQKNIIFIDDQQENVDGFNVLQKNNIALRYGIQFKSPQQLIEDFIKLGILSEVQDKQFLEEIRCSGIIDCMLMKIKRMINSVII